MEIHHIVQVKCVSHGIINFMGVYQAGYLEARFGQMTDDEMNSNGHPMLAKGKTKITNEPGAEEAYSIGRYIAFDNREQYKAGDFSVGAKVALPYHWGNDMGSPDQTFVVKDIDGNIIHHSP